MKVNLRLFVSAFILSAVSIALIYFAPIHLQPFYAKTFGFKTGDFPVAEHAAERVVALPFFNRITDEEIDEVGERLEKLCGAN